MEELGSGLGSAVMRHGRGGMNDPDAYQYPVVDQHQYRGHGRGHQTATGTVADDGFLRFCIALHVAYTHPSWRTWPGRAGTETVYECRVHVLVLVSRVTAGDGMGNIGLAAYLSVHAAPGSP